MKGDLSYYVWPFLFSYVAWHMRKSTARIICLYNIINKVLRLFWRFNCLPKTELSCPYSQFWARSYHVSLRENRILLMKRNTRSDILTDSSAPILYYVKRTLKDWENLAADLVLSQCNVSLYVSCSFLIHPFNKINGSHQQRNLYT